MDTKEKARAKAGQESICSHNSTPTLTLRGRIQLSRQLACTFEATAEPLRVNVYWHGKANPSRMGGLAFARYRRARDSFLECRRRTDFAHFWRAKFAHLGPSVPARL